MSLLTVRPIGERWSVAAVGNQVVNLGTFSTRADAIRAGRACAQILGVAFQP
jgi:hypothetical protein